MLYIVTNRIEVVTFNFHVIHVQWKLYNTIHYKKTF